MPGRLVFSTTASGASSPTERMRIDSAGRVGINRTAPDNQLSIGSTASFHTDENSFYLGSNFTGTGSNFIATGKHAQRLFFNNASINGYLSYSNTSSAGTSGNAITWEERLRITSAGNVGIGISSPDANLHIKGSYPTVHIQRDSATNYSRLLLDNTANDGGAIDGIGDGTGGLRFATSDAGTITERMRIDSSGAWDWAPLLQFKN